MLLQGSVTTDFPALFTVAAALAVVDLVAYTGYSTVNELLAGDSPGAS
jgi:hypothetical protein